jgi:hypothetical protein
MEMRAAIRARIRRFRKRESLRRLLEGAVLSGSVIAVMSLVALQIEQAFFLEPPARTGLFWGIAVMAAALVLSRIVPFLLAAANIVQGETDLRLAAQIGEVFPHIGDRLLNALQIFSQERRGGLYSASLADAALEDVYRDLATVNLDGATDFSTARRWGVLFFSLAGAGVLLFSLLPTVFFGALDRLWNYEQSFTPPSPFALVVEPGNLTVVKGARVSITVRAEGALPPSLDLAMRPEGELREEVITLTPGEDRTFRYDIPSLRYAITYSCRAQGVHSNEYRLSVVDRPGIKALRLTLEPPAYSGLEVRQLEENVGDATVLKGTIVALHIEATKPLAQASMVQGDGTRRFLEVREGSGRIRFKALSDLSYEIHLKDDAGLENAEPVRYSLHVTRDADPRIAIEIPGTNLDVAGSEDLQVIVRVSDDYGFSRLRLAHRLTSSRYEQPAAGDSYIDIPIPSGIGSEGTVPFQWPLSTLSLVPEDVVTYYVEVFDNDVISGPKSARSQEYTLRLPSLEEVFADAEKSQEAGIENLRKALDDAKEARKDLEEFQREMRRQQESMQWQEQKQATELARKYEEVQKKVSEVTAAVDSMIKEMKKNEILSPETLRKYEELRQLMEELDTPELTEALRNLQEAMQRFDPESLEDALQQLDMSEEQLRKNIERTINLLKRLQIEQKVDEVIRRAEELLKQQEELQRTTEQANKEEHERLADQQSDLEERLAALEQEMKNLQKMMEEFPSEMPLEEMQQALAEMDSSNLVEEMQEISEQLRRQQMSEASKGQKSAGKKMGGFLDHLREMQEKMRQNQQQQIVNELRKVYQDLLELSKREEELKNRTSGLQGNSPQFREEKGEQMEVLRDLGRVTERLSAVAQKSFGVTPDMGRPIGEAMKHMTDAMDALEKRAGLQSASSQSGAMASLNEAAQRVQAGMNAMMQGEGQGMGMAGLMQQLQGMSSMQQGINQGTRHLGGMGERQAAELGRLAGDQGMVRKSMEQLAKEAARHGEMSKLLGDLNRIAQEMREVQTDLAQGNVRPETLRKQDRILSRLLDSQRSMRERDYERTRKAETGREQRRERSAQAGLSLKERLGRLQDDLNKARDQGYARDYQELIRKYFELLETEEIPR